MQSIKGIAGVVAQVDHIAAANAAAVEQQGAATQEIVRSVAATAEATNSVAYTISQVSAEMDGNGGAVRDLQAATGQVNRGRGAPPGAGRMGRRAARRLMPAGPTAPRYPPPAGRLAPSE